MTDFEKMVKLTESPLEATSVGDTAFSKEWCEFKKTCKCDGNEYFQYLALRREDLPLLCSTLRVAFGSDCLDPRVKFREFL